MTGLGRELERRVGQRRCDVLANLGYNGAKTTHAVYCRNINDLVTPQATIQAQQRRFNPQGSSIDLVEFAANANYNSFTVRAEKRFMRPEFATWI